MKWTPPKKVEGSRSADNPKLARFDDLPDDIREKSSEFIWRGETFLNVNDKLGKFFILIQGIPEYDRVQTMSQNICKKKYVVDTSCDECRYRVLE